METTLGKRIMLCRKKMGLTQDKLAELLGVTAQAVSKWENDQSCPDITMLPKLAELFQISTDELLGVANKDEPAAEEKAEEPVVLEGTVEDQEHAKIHIPEFAWHWEGGKWDGLTLAVTVLLVGVLTLLSKILDWGASFWSILWPSLILMVGLGSFGKRFSFFGVSCVLLGGYFLLDNLNVIQFTIAGELVFPILIVLFGISLLIDALKKPKYSRQRFHHQTDGMDTINKNVPKSNCCVDGDTFTCTLAFGENHHHISMPLLTHGEISCSFGELTVELDSVEEYAENCSITASCSFGELQMRVPRSVRVEPNTSTAFAGMSFEGTPDAEPKAILHLDAKVSFGEITVRYI